MGYWDLGKPRTRSALQVPGTTFRVWATMPNGRRRRATVFGEGADAKEQLANATAKARAMFPLATRIQVV
jgi:hypothetical protein